MMEPYRSPRQQLVAAHRRERDLQGTLLDFLVAALNPLLIMTMVGSLLFFLVAAFYRGEMEVGVYWTFFWFTLANVLVTRIGLEQNTLYSGLYGTFLALATFLYLMSTGFSMFWSILFLALVWWCSHRLVIDCTHFEGKKESMSAGRSVLYFALAALPVFGVGGWFTGSGLGHLLAYLIASFTLLLTTAFLGMRRYLRARRVRMSPQVALTWLFSGTWIMFCIVLLALALPRPEVITVPSTPEHTETVEKEVPFPWNPIARIAVLSISAVFLVIHHRKVMVLLSDLGRMLFARRRHEGRPGKEEEQTASDSSPSFREFPNPFRSGTAREWSRDRLVIYTYEALEAWARETGYRGTPDQTPIERTEYLSRHHPGLDSFVCHLGELYSHLAYGRRLPRSDTPFHLEKIWASLTPPPDDGADRRTRT